MHIFSNCQQWVDCSAGNWSVANCLLDWSNGPLYEINLCQWASLLIHSYLLRGKSFISRQSVSTAVRRLCLNLSEHHLLTEFFAVEQCSGDPHKRKQENLIYQVSIQRNPIKETTQEKASLENIDKCKKNPSQSTAKQFMNMK